MLKKFKELSKKTKIIIGVVLGVLMLAVIGSQMPEDAEANTPKELTPLSFDITSLEFKIENNVGYIIGDVEVTNTNDEAMEFDYYFELRRTLGGKHGETGLYNGGDACQDLDTVEANSTQSCKIVYDYLNESGEYSIWLVEDVFFDPEELKTITFDLSEYGDITIK